MGNLVKVTLTEVQFNKLEKVCEEAQTFIDNYSPSKYSHTVTVPTWWGLSSKKVKHFKIEELEKDLPDYLEVKYNILYEKKPPYVSMSDQGFAIKNIIDLYLAGSDIYLDNYHAKVFNKAIS